MGWSGGALKEGGLADPVKYGARPTGFGLGFADGGAASPPPSPPPTAAEAVAVSESSTSPLPGPSFRKKKKKAKPRGGIPSSSSNSSFSSSSLASSSASFVRGPEGPHLSAARASLTAARGRADAARATRDAHALRRSGERRRLAEVRAALRALRALLTLAGAPRGATESNSEYGTRLRAAAAGLQAARADPAAGVARRLAAALCGEHCRLLAAQFLELPESGEGAEGAAEREKRKKGRKRREEEARKGEEEEEEDGEDPFVALFRPLGAWRFLPSAWRHALGERHLAAALRRRVRLDVRRLGRALSSLRPFAPFFELRSRCLRRLCARCDSAPIKELLIDFRPHWGQLGESAAGAAESFLSGAAASGEAPATRDFREAARDALAALRAALRRWAPSAGAAAVATLRALSEEMRGEWPRTRAAVAGAMALAARRGAAVAAPAAWAAAENDAETRKAVEAEVEAWAARVARVLAAPPDAQEEKEEEKEEREEEIEDEEKHGRQGHIEYGALAAGTARLAEETRPLLRAEREGGRVREALRWAWATLAWAAAGRRAAPPAPRRAAPGMRAPEWAGRRAETLGLRELVAEKAQRLGWEFAPGKRLDEGVQLYRLGEKTVRLDEDFLRYFDEKKGNWEYFDAFIFLKN